MQFGVSALSILGAEFRELSKAWVERFCPNVKRQTGKWMVNGYRWHAYSFDHERCISGRSAIEIYISMAVQPFVMFLESEDLMFACEAEQWPNICTFQDDIYIFPRTMDWTFVTTHEMSLGLGPYFATPPQSVSSSS